MFGGKVYDVLCMDTRVPPLGGGADSIGQSTFTGDYEEREGLWKKASYQR